MMDPERWQRVEPILEEALELPPEKRPAFLDRACPGDPELRSELEALLAADEKTRGPLEAPIGDYVARLLRDERSGPAQRPAAGNADRFLPGTMLAGRYRIVNVVGRGGMGEVFRADDLKLDVPVALKFLPSGLAADQERLSLLLNEVRIARQITHPHVCRVFDAGEVDGLHFISMEYVDGEDLATLLRRIGRLPQEKAVEIARGICEGLEAVHEQGILHRDLKPANLMIDDRGRVRITDFGLAALAETVVGAAVRCGTPAYMAPEQRAGREVSVQSDLYALGLVLYELFTGRPAFAPASHEEQAGRHREATLIPPSRLVEGLDPAIERVILRCLEEDPRARPASAQAVADALPGRSAPAAGTVLQTLLAGELVAGGRLVERLGETDAAELFARHDRLARDLLAEHGGRDLAETDAGFLLLFARPIHAVLYAQAYHQALSELAPAAGGELTARVGIHLGEVVLRRSSPEDGADGVRPLVAEGLARTMVTRLMSLATGGQTLLTRTAFDVARSSAAGEIAGADQLHWLAHGKYLFDDFDEAIEVFEVGAEGAAPLTPPESSEEAARVPGEDVVLGWRPAPGLALPGRAHWTVEKKLGTGGFGEVWLGVHRKTGERRVFKFCYEASRLRALRREITLFRLLKEELGERGDIARILDWNFEEAPFFIESEYTAGGNLGEWAEEQGGLESVPLAVRLELVAQVAEALAAAHSVGVLHKDVKPSNVLIYRDVEGRPRARLTDFGVGSITEHRRLVAAGITIMGFTERTETTPSTFTGTRLYMAPEVLEGKTATLQADVYALGVVLYQLVAGDLTRALAPGWDRDVDDELLRDDVAAAVDGMPERRLASARELAERLRSLAERRAQREAERRLREEAEHTRAALERAWRRRRSMAAAIAVLALFAGAMGLLALRIQRETERAEREAARAKNFARVAVAEAWIKKDPTRAALVLLEVVTPEECTLAVPAIRKLLQHRLATLELAGPIRGYPRKATWSPNGDRFITYSFFDPAVRVWSADGSGEPISLEGHRTVGHASFSPRGDRILVVSGTEVKVWNVRTRASDGSGEPIVLEHQEWVNMAAWDPHGDRIVVLLVDGTLWVQDAADGSGESFFLGGQVGDIQTAALSPGGDHIATASENGKLRIWNVRMRTPDGSGGPIGLERPKDDRQSQISQIAWSPSGDRIVTAAGSTAWVWNINGRDRQNVGHSLTLEGHQSRINSVSWSPDGKRILTTSWDRTARIWNVRLRQSAGAGDPVVLKGHQGPLFDAAWSPDGERVVTASEDGTARVWSTSASGSRAAESMVLGGHRLAVRSAAFNPTGDRIVTASDDGTARVWCTGTPDPGRRRIAGSSCGLVGEPITVEGDFGAWSPEADRIVLFSGDSQALVWSIGESGITGRPIILQPNGGIAVSGNSLAVFSPGGDRIFISVGRHAWVWRADGSGEPLALEGYKGRSGMLRLASFSPNGERILLVNITMLRRQGTARVWNTRVGANYGSGEPITFGDPEDSVNTAAWSPDGNRIATGSLDGIVRVWNARLGPAEGSGPPMVLGSHERTVHHVSWSPGGDRIVTASADNTARIWKADGSGESVILAGHADTIWTASWSPAGDRILTASSDHTARIWKVDGSSESVVVQGHDYAVRTASWSPTGDRIVTGSDDRTARIWNVDGSGEAIILEGHEGPVGIASFSPNGDRALTAGGGKVRIWRLDTEELIGLIRTATKVCLVPAFREKYLDEKSGEAWQRYAACERSHGRVPASPQ